MNENFKQSFVQLGFSRAFCAQAERMGLQDLGEALELSPDELLGLAAFSYGWLGELATFLEERGSLHLLQTIPGKSDGRSF